MSLGLALEIIGYAGRIQLHFNPFPFDPFLESVQISPISYLPSLPSSR